jgi:hypothetical protein
MGLKTVARRLEPWVPTSTEWRKEQLRTAAEVAAEVAAGTTVTASQLPPVGATTEGDDGVDEEGPIDAEFVDEPHPPLTGWQTAWGEVGNVASQLGWDVEQAKAEFTERNPTIPFDRSSVEDLQAFAAHLRTLTPAGAA